MKKKLRHESQKCTEDTVYHLKKYKQLTEMTNYSPTFLLCPQEFHMQNDSAVN